MIKRYEYKNGQVLDTAFRKEVIETSILGKPLTWLLNVYNKIVNKKKLTQIYELVLENGSEIINIYGLGESPLAFIGDEVFCNFNESMTEVGTITSVDHRIQGGANIHTFNITLLKDFVSLKFKKSFSVHRAPDGSLILILEGNSNG